MCLKKRDMYTRLPSFTTHSTLICIITAMITSILTKTEGIAAYDAAEDAFS